MGILDKNDIYNKQDDFFRRFNKFACNSGGYQYERSMFLVIPDTVKHVNLVRKIAVNRKLFIIAFSKGQRTDCQTGGIVISMD